MKTYVVIFTHTDYHCVYAGVQIVEAKNETEARELANVKQIGGDPYMNSGDDIEEIFEIVVKEK